LNLEREVFGDGMLKRREGRDGHELFPYLTYRSEALLGYKGDSVMNTCGGSCPEARRSRDRTEKQLTKVT
jgi:hypothetical protein